MKLWTGFLDLLFPPKCPFCQKILDDPRGLVCPACQRDLPWLTGEKALRRVEFTEGCLSPLAYRDGVPGAFQRYKFSGVRACARPFGALMAQCARDNLPCLPDAVTWAPLSRRRRRKRGFDQTELLARKAAGALALPLVPTLEKHRDTPPQSSLSDPAARRANARGVYRLLPGAEAEMEGKTFLLVDDVVTSGATLSACADVLLQGGACAVRCLTLAQARPDPSPSVREAQKKDSRGGKI